MDINKIIKAVLALPGAGQPDGAQVLQPGDKLRGRVLRLESDGRVLVDFGRFQAFAQTQVPLSPGQLLNLCVLDSGSPLQLRLMPSEGPAGAAPPVPEMDLAGMLDPAEQRRLVDFLDLLSRSASQMATGNDPSIATGLRLAPDRIRMIFEHLSLELPSHSIAEALKGCFEEGGHFFETRLADAILEASAAEPGPDRAGATAIRAVVDRDVKAQLLVLLSRLAQESPADHLIASLPAKDLSFLRSALGRLLNHIEIQQQSAIQQASPDAVLNVMSYRLPVAELRRPIKFKIYYPKKETGERPRRPHRAALLLALDRLGTMRIDVSLPGRRGLRVDFFVKEGWVRQAIEKQSRMLVDALSADFDSVQIAMHVNATKVKNFETEDDLSAFAGAVDIKV